MSSNEIVWPDPIIRKIRSFASSHFSADETFDHILSIIIEAEELMLNKVISRTYVEEDGEYKGYSRILIKKFRIYFKEDENVIVVVGLLFPGEN